MTSPILGLRSLGFPWETLDPFLFCVHHDDAYPAGNAAMGPAASLAGRRMGQDFQLRDGWRMYHGRTVPGFPQHPHRGFETVTLARRGYIDHSDSMGAHARFGHGDAQWMTAGAGVVHSEMFPLVNTAAPNPTELFQIWLNLPAADKMVPPHFTMLWNETIPRPRFTDEGGAETEVAVVAGDLPGGKAPEPPPHSWANRDDAHVAIWTIRMAPNARWTVPVAAAGLNRALYLFAGNGVRIADQHVSPGHRVHVRSDAPITLQNGPTESELLMLQGRPIGEPVVQMGPFVMNSRAGIQKAFDDYEKTGFGGWPWDRNDPVHDRDRGRFAVHADGRTEDPLA